MVTRRDCVGAAAPLFFSILARSCPALRSARACKLAGVMPEVRHLNGEDPTAYVLSANVHRRDLTAGQRAMAVAMLRPKPSQAREGIPSA